MEITESRRLYQQLAAELKDRIEQGSILSVINFPLSVSLRMKSVSRTVVREAIIMLEVEGYVEVRKGSGIHVISSRAKHSPPRTKVWSLPATVRLSFSGSPAD